MTEQEKELLIQGGFDVEKALSRFLKKEDLYVSFLKKYENDGNFQKIEPALEKGNLYEAYHAIHALKGLSGNLGILNVFQTTQDMLKEIKARPGFDVTNDKAVFETLQAEDVLWTQFQQLSAGHLNAVELISKLG